MTKAGLPPKQGLYDPQFEHDACGVGFVVNIKGEKSREIVEQALTVLQNLDHRGACGCEENTGDGAGILMEEGFEPRDGVDVEMIGRLVEQQQIGLGDERLREQHAAPPAAR